MKTTISMGGGYLDSFFSFYVFLQEKPQQLLPKMIP